MALRLARDGADVALTFQQNQQRADEVIEQRTGRRATAIPADSADPTAVTAEGRYITGATVNVDGGFTI